MKIEIYTDGSCSKNNVDNLEQEDKGGYGYCIIKDGEKIAESSKCYANTTNNRMEMRAIIDSLKYCFENYPNDEIVVYTDSALIVNTINQKWYKKWMINGWRKSDRTPVKNPDLWKELLHMNSNAVINGKVKIEKVKGHSNVDYNNRADYLANLWRTKNDEDFIIDKK